MTVTCTSNKQVKEHHKKHDCLFEKDGRVFLKDDQQFLIYRMILV